MDGIFPCNDIRTRLSMLNDVPTSDVPSITKSVVNHVQTSLARQAYNLDNLGAYQAAALSVRDNLIVRHFLHSHLLLLISPLSSFAQNLQ